VCLRVTLCNRKFHGEAKRRHREPQRFYTIIGLKSFQWIKHE
jgi:hypothetical protein